MKSPPKSGSQGKCISESDVVCQTGMLFISFIHIIIFTHNNIMFHGYSLCSYAVSSLRKCPYFRGSLYSWESMQCQG